MGLFIWHLWVLITFMFILIMHTFFLFFFRDNGITIQILKYQLYCEGFMFLLVLFAAIIPIENDVLVYRIIGIMYSFVVFVMQPLFYLNGDVNFRNRVLQQGLWKALDQELFQRNTQIQPITPWCKRILFFSFNNYHLLFSTCVCSRDVLKLPNGLS